jgi:hypothetical protein
MSILRRYLDPNTVTESVVTEEPAAPKSFAMALNIACTGGNWHKADGIAQVYVFKGTFPSEGVEAEVHMDVNNKTYDLIVTKNGNEIIHDRKEYRVSVGVAAAVAFRLSQEAFGTPNEPVTESGEAMPRIEFKEHRYKNTEDLFISLANFEASGPDLDTVFALAAMESSYVEDKPQQFSHEGHNFRVDYGVDKDGDEVLTVTLLPSVAGTGETLVSENVAVGDEVTVDGEDAVVKNPDAPGDTASVLVNGEEKMVRKDEVKESRKPKLDEMVLGMTAMPDISRMQALAGVRTPAVMAADIPLAQVAANVKAVTAETPMASNALEAEPEVIDLSKGEECETADASISTAVEDALAVLERNIENLTVAQFKAAKSRLDALANVMLAEGRTRARKL